MTTASNELADALLEQHVQHELSALKGEKLRRFLMREVDELFDLAAHMTLGRLTSAERVMGLIRRVVINMRLAPGIPEMAADMATEVLNAPIQKTTPLNEIISHGQASGFLEQALELKQQRERVISEIMSHPVYQELVSNLVYQGVMNYLYEDNMLSRSVPGVGSMMKFGKRLANRAVPGLDESFERRLKSWLADSLPGLISRGEQFLHRSLTDEELRDSVRAAWVSVEDLTVEELREGMGDLQLQEFVMLGYEFWLEFRKTPYFEGCVQAVVTHLFELYGDRPLLDLLGDMGVNEDLVKAEIDGFFLPVIDALREEGYLEALVRRRLAPFYASAAARNLLSRRG